MPIVQISWYGLPPLDPLVQQEQREHEAQRRAEEREDDVELHGTPRARSPQTTRVMVPRRPRQVSGKRAVGARVRTARHPVGMNDRDRRRARRRRKAGKDYRATDLGNGVEVATAEAVMRAVGSLPRDLDWEELAPSVIPVLPRRRPLPAEAGPPFRVTLPPGIPTGFGIDIGPALLVVGESLLAGWPVGPADLVARALANLQGRLRPVRPRDVADLVDRRRSRPDPPDGARLRIGRGAPARRARAASWGTSRSA